MNLFSAIGFSIFRKLLLGLVCCIPLSNQAQTRVEIPADSIWAITLIDELEVVGDEQRKWSAESLFAASDDLFGPNTISAKPKLNNYWGRFELANTTDSEQWLSFESYYWDYVTLYFRDSTGKVTMLPFGILSNPHQDKFLARPQMTYQVLANFESSGQFRREDNINLVIKSMLPALEKVIFSNYIDGITFGVMLGLSLYNLFLFISLCDRVYLWYTLYIFSFALSFATLFASTPPKWTLLFFPEYPSFAFYLKKIADPVIWISYTNFVRSFLATKNKYPVWDKVLRVCIVLIILQFLINLTGIYHFSGVSRVILWNTVVFLCVLLAISSYMRGHYRARFFLLGQFFLLAGIFITIMYYANLDAIFFLPNTEFFDYFRSPTSIFAFGAVESVVFSFALADKYNMLQKDIVRVNIEKEKEKSEALRLQELDTFKTRFYSNITHEFRTPLTVISGMADELKNNPAKEPDKKIGLIKKNSQSLLSLVNQMLDLSKLQAGKMASDVRQDDIILFLKYLTEAHESFAKTKNVGLQFYSEEKELLMDFDSKKMEQVLNNIISNAIKFTPRYGKILVVAKQLKLDGSPFLEIKIRDTGIGISKEQLPHIFDRYHQANPAHENQGSGIGLALVKELVANEEGKIKVESEVDKGTVFYLHFPIKNNMPVVLPEHDFKTAPMVILENENIETPTTLNDNLPILLIIEDNADVVYYLKTCLENQYQIIHARNGKMGIEKAMEMLPDIIISDVMMPEMDGFEVCRILKEDGRTDHIPIILLTAKATQQDKLAGLQKGADAYLTKPFEKEELSVRLEKLMEVRKKLQLKYSGALMAQKSESDATPSKEDLFIEKLESIVLENMENNDFSIHELSRALLLSRSQVHRKIKALTGMSTAIYIRHVRLQKARELLTTTDLSISEIAYRVGFKTPVYFSQAFKEAFGESPSATRN